MKKPGVIQISTVYESLFPIAELLIFPSLTIFIISLSFKENIIIITIMVIFYAFYGNVDVFVSWEVKTTLQTIELCVMFPGIILGCFAFLTEIKNKKLRIILKLLTPFYSLFWIGFWTIAIKYGKVSPAPVARMRSDARKAMTNRASGNDKKASVYEAKLRMDAIDYIESNNSNNDDNK